MHFLRESLSNFLFRNLNKLYFKSTMTIDGVSTIVFKHPTIVEAAQEYFNCPSITYVRLENQGGSGSAGVHWERKWFGNEVNSL